jgi:uroporphyrinogen-III decarboxylase
MVFDPEKYRGRIEESRKRLEITSRFEEPDRVPIKISESGSFHCWRLGYDIAEYYQDVELQIEVQLKGLEWTWEELRDDRTGYGLHAETGPLGEALLWGCEIQRPAGTSPWIVPCVQTLKDIEELPVPDPAQAPGVQWALERREQMKELARRKGIALDVGGGVGIHPPLSAACALAPADKVYEWMYTDPDHIRLFFGKLLEAFFRLVEFNDRRNGVKEHRSIGLADDHSAFVSDAMYREMVLPYNKAIYDRYGRDGRYLHADGPNNHHFETYANVMKLTQMDIGGFSDIAAAKQALAGKVVMSGGLNCRDLYGDFESARPVVERAIRIGAPGGGYILAIGGETYAGVNPETLIRTVEYAKQIGRYPISV